MRILIHFIVLFSKMFYRRAYLWYYLLMLPIHCLKDKKDTSEDKTRFLKDFDDEEWHISHLRSLEDDLRECEGETFVEKARRYRKALKNDGALVELVSSNAIPFNPHEVNTDVCKDNPLKLKSNSSLANFNTTNNKITTESDGEVRSATISAKDSLKESERPLVSKTQRRSEYQFSSVEYYDEVQDFDTTKCPEDVEMITLELDQLRNYYVECERIVEWRSLEEPQ